MHACSDRERGFCDGAAFSAQQAAEGALKSVFQHLVAEAWGHSVADLLLEPTSRRQVPRPREGLPSSWAMAYISTRYPNALLSGSTRRRYSPDEEERLVGHAEAMNGFCAGLLSED